LVYHRGVLSKQVSIVIRCLNENKNLNFLIPLLLGQTYKNFEILFVDSGSDDGTLNTISNYLREYENISLHHIKKNKFTFGRSLNIGFTNSKGEIIISLSAHCFPKNNKWLENIVSSFSDEKVGIVYGCQSPHLQTMHSEASVQKTWFSGESRIISGVFLNNGNAAYRKKVWEENKFDEKLTGLEDIELGKRAKNNGWEIYYCSEANVEHLHKENYKTIQNRYRREAEAMKNINKTDKSNDSVIKNTFFYCFKGFLRGVNYDIKTSKDSLQPNNDFINILRYRFSQYLGTYRGYKNDMSKNKMTDLYFYPPKL
tara:strand:- start:925 stop:1863 length:939 start_codon:yes stop_codon:yes gene_type:complete